MTPINAQTVTTQNSDEHGSRSLSIDRRGFVKTAAAVAGRLDALSSLLPAVPATVATTAAAAGAALSGMLDSVGALFWDAFLPSYGFELLPDGVSARCRRSGRRESLEPVSLLGLGIDPSQLAKKIRDDFNSRVIGKCRHAITASRRVVDAAHEAGLNLDHVGRLVIEKGQAETALTTYRWAFGAQRNERQYELAKGHIERIDRELQGLFDRAGFSDLRASEFGEASLFQCFHNGSIIRLDRVTGDELLREVHRQMFEIQRFLTRHLRPAGFDPAEIKALVRSLRSLFEEDFAVLKAELRPAPSLLWSSRRWIDHEQAWALAHAWDKE